MAGISISSSCIEEFNNFKLDSNKSYLILHVADEKEVVVEKIGDSTESYDDFMSKLPDEDCRYGLFHFNYQHNDGVHEMQKSKLILFFWSPSGTSLRNRMIYTTTKNDLKNSFRGISVEVQATERLSFEEVLEKVES